MSKTPLVAAATSVATSLLSHRRHPDGFTKIDTQAHIQYKLTDSAETRDRPQPRRRGRCQGPDEGAGRRWRRNPRLEQACDGESLGLVGLVLVGDLRLESGRQGQLETAN